MLGSFFEWLLKHIKVYFPVVVHECIHPDVVLEDTSASRSLIEYIRFNKGLPDSATGERFLIQLDRFECLAIARQP
jgi:hypothetical protein